MGATAHQHEHLDGEVMSAMRTSARLGGLLIVGLLLVGALLIGLRQSVSTAVAVESTPPGFASALAPHGQLFTPAADPAVASRMAGVSAEVALRIAKEQVGSARAGEAHVYIGTLTVENLRQAGDDTPRLIEDRLVYAVQITGLRLPPLGMPADSAPMHGELVLFIDATSGEFLLATTVR